MPDDPERAWQHPWLRVSCLIRGITGTLLERGDLAHSEGGSWLGPGRAWPAATERVVELNVQIVSPE